ncbi:hypothetical protein Csa_007620 [Cucumis sativus]|uniref:Uncharacterized protein n=1 Tax=Cucumis sativus TaxID=3659 RepID=A0A0A0M313_CUCSA|nr:hypothetical protein Csa_007620 [Cucumis sativus]
MHLQSQKQLQDLELKVDNASTHHQAQSEVLKAEMQELRLHNQELKSKNLKLKAQNKVIMRMIEQTAK